MLFTGVVLCFLAIILGSVCLKLSRRTPPSHNRKIAITGILLGIISLVSTIIFVFLLFLSFSTDSWH
jgi:hypothetical protein